MGFDVIFILRRAAQEYKEQPNEAKYILLWVCIFSQPYHPMANQNLNNFISNVKLSKILSGTSPAIYPPFDVSCTLSGICLCANFYPNGSNHCDETLFNLGIHECGCTS